MNRISFLNRGYAFKGLLAVSDVNAKPTILNHKNLLFWATDFYIFTAQSMLKFVHYKSMFYIK